MGESQDGRSVGESSEVGAPAPGRLTQVPGEEPPRSSGTAPSRPMSEDEPVRATCSAKGCSAAATWELRWNNPRLHTPDRRKVWLACDDHKGTLGDFLGARGFLREVVPH